MIKSAIKYLELGFSIIPCKIDKRPLIKWEPFQKEKPSEDQIKEWWAQFPEANIAIITGAISGINVIDCDTEEAYQLLNNDFLPETFQSPVVKTPNGYHIYFRYQEGISNAVRVIKGTDVRSNGGYVIAPPSQNGNKKKYAWFEGLGVHQILLQEMPAMLFDVLVQSSYLHNNTSIYNIYNNNIYKGQQSTASTKSTKSTSDDIFLREGRRDNDLFHVANCLIKGGCSTDVSSKVLEILALNCNPPFDKKDIPIKIKSALSRQENRDRSLTSEVREFILSTSGYILSTNVHKCLHLSTRKERKAVSTIMARLCEEGLIEKTDRKHGEYRVLDQDCKPMDWINVDDNYIDLWLPLGLDQIAGVLPGNIILFAGAKDSGKSAFCMNIAKENRHKYKVHYFNSEMGPGEFKMRASKFTDIHVSQWNNVDVYERFNNFQDVVKSGEGNLNIIDFLEVPEEIWKVGSAIQKIHLKLKGAICVIALQKKIGVDLGRGAEFSMEKARLYVSLDYGHAKIISCKNFRPESPIGNPRGYSCRFKLVDGCRILKQKLGWQSPIKNEE